VVYLSVTDELKDNGGYRRARDARRPIWSGTATVDLKCSYVACVPPGVKRSERPGGAAFREVRKPPPEWLLWLVIPIVIVLLAVGVWKIVKLFWVLGG